MAFKVNDMKKETTGKKDKNQVFWEEFVFKNRIKKKVQGIAALDSAI